MSAQSKIEWTDATWNPVRGCDKVSAGCKYCYAERFAERFRGVPNHPFETGFDLKLIPTKLTEPLRWRTPRRIFVNSMSDLFHEDIPEEYIDSVLETMLQGDWHTYQVLTKRADRLARFLRRRRKHLQVSHIWWGVSVENRRHGLPRVRALQRVSVPVRFLSVEPLLEDIGRLPLKGIGWVIVGGESGPGARPMEASWVRSIRRQCRAAKVPFFFKQWGGANKSATGRELDGRTYDAIPAFAMV